jgi:hypothetical protein
VSGEQQDGHAEQGEQDEVERAVDGDQAEDDLVAQRLAAKRELDLVAGGGVLAVRRRGRTEGKPAVAAQAAVPANPVLLVGDQPVLGADRARAEPDQLVPRSAAGDQLPVELGAEALRLDDAGVRAVRAEVGDRGNLLLPS